MVKKFTDRFQKNPLYTTDIQYKVAAFKHKHIAADITGLTTFSTIAVSGQSNVVSDTSSDTLTIVAGTNITITTDATADSITINASGGGGGLTQPQIMAIQSFRF